MSVGRHVRQNAVGYIALVVAVIGVPTAWGIAHNSVGSAQIKRNAVKASDIADGAVRSGEVQDDTISGQDVAEETLGEVPRATAADTADVAATAGALEGLTASQFQRSGATAGGDLSGSYPDPQLGAEVVGPAETADQARRIVIPASDLRPSSPTNDNPEVFNNSGHVLADYDPGATDSAAALTEVPLDRASGSPLEVRLLWSANGVGDVVWQVGTQAMSVGAATGSVPTGADLVDTSGAANTLIRSSSIEVPAGQLTNGQPLALRVARAGANGADTLAVFAHLHLIEITYTATG